MADIGIGTSRVLIDPSDGDALSVTGGVLDVNATLVAGAAIDIGDVEILGHGAVVHFALQVKDSGNSGPTQLTSQACKHADIMARIGNSGIIYIGALGVSTTLGIALYAGDVYSVDVSNTNLLYALATVNNDNLNVVTYG